MNNTNKEYYKRVYDKVHASEELKERLMDMRGENKMIRTEGKKRNHVAWKAAAAAVVLAVTIPTGVYAATHYFDMNEFFSKTGHKLSEDANKLIETEIPQTQKKDITEEMPVEFTAQEALCDSGSVSLIIEAKAKTRGKYLLAYQDCLETDPVSNLGIKGKGTIGEYAEERGLEILYLGTSFAPDSPFNPSTCSIDYKLAEDDVLEIGITGERTADQKGLNVIMLNTVQTSVGSEEILKSTNSFELHDKSSSETALYTAKGDMKVKGTSAVVTKITVETTEVNNYVKVYFTSADASDEDGLTFRFRDSKDAEEWDGQGGYVEQLGDGKYCQHLTYNAGKLPEKCILEAFNCWEKNVYGQFEVSLTK